MAANSPATPVTAHPSPSYSADPFDASRHDGFAAAEAVQQNQTYIGNRLMFSRGGEVENSFVHVVTIGHIWALLKSLIIQQFLILVMTTVLAWVVVIVVSIYDLATDTSPLLSGKVPGAPAIILIVLLGAAFAVVSFVGWLRQGSQVPISDWDLLLDQKRARAEDVYGAIMATMRRRGLDAQISATRIQSDLTAAGIRNYLVISRDSYVIYVSVLPYGTGLFLSWSMWREMTLVRFFKEWIRQARLRYRGAGGYLNMILRAEPIRAMREVVHNSVREGVEVALSGETVDLARAFDGYVPPVVAAPAGGGSDSFLPPRPNLPPPVA